MTSVALTMDARRLFTDRHASYSRFIRTVLYPQGLESYFVRSPLLRAGLRVLDAGCGTGALTLAFRAAMVRRGLALDALQAFDLTPAMLDGLRRRLAARGIDDVELAEADVLGLDALPATWNGYDLMISASMLEYVPRERLVEALAALRARLRHGGGFVLFMTRRNALTRLMIGRWWASNLYTAGELHAAVRAAGFSDVTPGRFPPAAAHLTLWGHVVEARH